MARPKRKVLEAAEHQVGQDHPRDLPTQGPAELEPPVIEVVDGPNWKDKAKQLAFMEEFVEVIVHDTKEKNASRIVEVWCNGRAQFFLRNRPQRVKRKFVEVLARAKETSYTQEHYKDDNGNDAIRNIPHTALRDTFSVLRDDNPDGAAWLRKILAEH